MQSCSVKYRNKIRPFLITSITDFTSEFCLNFYNQTGTVSDIIVIPLTQVLLARYTDVYFAV